MPKVRRGNHAPTPRNLLAQGVEVWNRWKEDTHQVIPQDETVILDADLCGIDLHGASLNGINLGNVGLTEANIDGVQLIGANLAEAELTGATCVDARFMEADLSDADLGAADLTRADLSRTNLSGACLSGACLQGASLGGANLQMTSLYRADLRGADLRGADLSGAHLRGTSFYAASTNRLYLRWGQRRQARATGAVISQVSLRWPDRQSRDKDITLSCSALDRMFITGVLVILTCFFVDPVMIWNGSISPALGWTGCLVLAVVLLLLCWRWTHLPLFLYVNTRGVQYVCPSFAVIYKSGGATTRNVTLTWSEIGAIGCIRDGKVSSLVIYASARRWRSGWAPTLRITQPFLPLPVEELLKQLHTRYQTQFEAGRILDVDVQITRKWTW
ncbi:MAG TPA: pentapeptide repeat-containing protein [Ktedonobacteraceae bacterium]